MEINWKRNLCVIWFSQILAMAGFSAIYPFVPMFFSDQYGITDMKERGVYMSVLTFCGMLSFSLAAPLWGWMADRWGRRRMLLRSYYVTGLLFPLLFFAPNVIWFTVIRFIVSAFSGTVSAAQTLVASSTPEEHQGFALGALSTAFWSGNMIGFIIGGIVVQHFGYMTGFLSCGAMYFLGGILVHTFVREDFVAKPATESRRVLRRDPLEIFRKWTPAIWLIMTIFMVMGMARRFDEPYLALLVETIGGKENAISNTSIVCVSAAVGGILSGYIFGKLCDRYSSEKIAFAMIICSCVGMLSQSAAKAVLPLVVARFVTFFFAGGLEPIFQTLLAHSSNVGERGALFGWASSIRVVGVMLSAALGGSILAKFGIRAVFIAGAVTMVTLIPLLKMFPKHGEE